jgi:hypothetical protein
VLLRWSQFHKQVGSFALVVLTLWLSGLGCSMCCIRDVATAHCEIEQVAAVQPTPTVTPESCQKAELDCCKKPVSKPAKASSSRSTELRIAAAKSARRPLQISQSSDVVGCSLLPKHIASLPVAPQYGDNLDVGAEPVPSTFTAITHLNEPQFLRPILPQNRGGTYLRLCVFLI